MKRFIIIMVIILTLCMVGFASYRFLQDWHIDTDQDSVCDICGVDLETEDPPVNEPCTEHKDENLDGKCDLCDAEVSVTPPACTEHKDENLDGKCDLCDAEVSVTTPACTEHKDENLDGKCDLCDAEVSVTPPACTEHKDEDHDLKCDYCDTEVPCAGHEDEDLNSKCDFCDADYEWNVAITDKSVTELWVSKTLQLSAGVTPVEKSLTWTSSDESVATVVDGLVTALKAGTVTIRVALTEAVYDEIALTVKAPIISTALNAANFDLSGIYQDDAIVKSNGQINSFVGFTGDASKYYVATVTANITGVDGADTWSRVGISHFNGTNSYYGFQVSPGVDYNQRKTVTMIITDGNVQWGTVTDRSQVWGQHDLASLDYSKVTITVVRNGSAFYAYVNGELYYVDELVEGFSDIDTLPVINVGSATAEFTNMSVSYGEEAAAAFLETADKGMFYASYGDTIINADGSIRFTGAAEGTCPLNAKDHAAKSIGTSAVLDAGVTSTVEFDLTIDCFGGRDGLPALAVTINRYDFNVTESRSLVIGQYKAGWTGWNSLYDLNAGIGSGGVEYAVNGETTRLEEGQTYHVVFTRVMTNNGQDTRMVITDKDGNVLIDHQHGWADGYSGRAVVSFLCRDVDCTISNIEIK